MSVARAVAIALCIAATGCRDLAPAPVEDGLVDDAALTRDVATSAGFSVAYLVENLVAHEDWAGRTHLIDGPSADRALSLTIARDNKCYNASAALIPCVPFTPVRMIVTNGAMHGSRSSNPGEAPYWNGVVHRTLNDTTHRIFTGDTETARVHTGVDLGNDTTTFYDDVIRRTLAETTVDSVKAVRLQLPHAARPVPVSGSIVRRVSARATIAKGERTASHDFTRRVEVIFPADAEGRVVLKVNALTCQLTLATRVVSNCQ